MPVISSTPLFFMPSDSTFIAKLNLQSPWYAAIHGTATIISRATNWREALNARSVELGLRNQRDLPIRFVPQSELSPDTAYETFISATGKVPTRDNLHDYFNALIWLTFPHIKRALNALQSAHIIRDGIRSTRGGVRDAATLFDENAALMIVRDNAAGLHLADSLRNHAWLEVLWQQRDAVRQHIEVWCFGHALLEKLVNPYKSITAHAWVITAPDEYFALTATDRRAWLDTHVAEDLVGSELRSARFTPLPILGIPGWWPQQNQSFYEDTAVFRPKRSVA